jgi:hypothetical protein
MIRKILILTPMILGLLANENLAFSAEDTSKALNTGPSAVSPEPVLPKQTEKTELKTSETLNLQILKDVRLITASIENLNSSLGAQPVVPETTKTQLQEYELVIHKTSHAILHAADKESDSTTIFKEFITKTDAFLDLTSTLSLSETDASILKATETLITEVKTETNLGEPKHRSWYSHLLGKSQSPMHEQSQSDLTPTEARLILQGATTIK